MKTINNLLYVLAPMVFILGGGYMLSFIAELNWQYLVMISGFFTILQTFALLKKGSPPILPELTIWSVFVGGVLLIASLVAIYDPENTWIDDLVLIVTASYIFFVAFPLLRKNKDQT
jgi:divalent metal cation (Fe/Co/Zn/Cd) transporter